MRTRKDRERTERSTRLGSMGDKAIENKRAKG